MMAFSKLLNCHKSRKMYACIMSIYIIFAFEKGSASVKTQGHHFPLKLGLEQLILYYYIQFNR